MFLFIFFQILIYTPNSYFPRNHLPVKFNETMMMVEAGEKLQKHLHLPSATSIVNYIEFIGYDENGNLVEYTESYSRPDKLEVRFGTNDI